ncbi:MAG: hypothetical protein ABIU20_00180 [Blastocatellia bacterium]
MAESPFSKKTKIHQTFMLLADREWHCGKHELPGTQPAKAIQIIRQHGYEIENKTIPCSTCGAKIVHRRLISTEPSSKTIVRSALPDALKKRVKAVYKNVEAVTQRIQPDDLEVDHRFPQVRWSKPEDLNPPGMSDNEIVAKFQLLTRQNNLWKSRYCERCSKSGVRGTFIGINYFYEGGPNWPSDIAENDERGCQGCFWYNPAKWRESLNRFIDQKQKNLF